LGADFDLAAFAHRAIYDDANARVEMHLVAERPQVVTIPGGGTYTFREGETVRTEISAKYDRDTIGSLFSAAGMSISRWCEDERGRYALVLGRPTES
jgi:L-histidine N-alpha-methyltransferase